MPPISISPPALALSLRSVALPARFVHPKTMTVCIGSKQIILFKMTDTRSTLSLCLASQHETAHRRIQRVVKQLWLVVTNHSNNSEDIWVIAVIAECLRSAKRPPVWLISSVLYKSRVLERGGIDRSGFPNL